MPEQQILIVIVGPTAVGKSDLAIDIALKYKVEIISADSRQVFRELNLGTAKPTDEALKKVKHHFINSHSIHDSFSAGHFEKEAIALIQLLHRDDKNALMVGGSGMYVDAVLRGFNEIPQVPLEIREKYTQLNSDKGLRYLQEQLRKSDPRYFESVDLSNTQRVIRALEVIDYTGQPFSDFLIDSDVKRDFRAIKIGLEWERKVLYERINERMDRMIREGLFEEAESLFEYRNLYALQTVGYSEIFEYLDGKYDRDEAIRLLKRNSRRYAKRQLTWFKRDEQVKWFQPNQQAEIHNYIESNL